MKKNIGFYILASLLVMLALTSCEQKPAALSTETVRVVGSAVRVPASTRAVAEGDTYVIDSVDAVIIDGKDIKDSLVPADPAALTGDKVNNVTFKAEVTIPSNVDFTAEGKKGYVFDEWEVLEVEEEEEEEEEGKRAVAPADPAFLEEIEDWLELEGREHSETLKNVPAAYIPYLVAEYDNGFYITLDAKAEGAAAGDGTKANPYTVQEFIDSKYDEDEVTLVISGTDAEAFAGLMTALEGMNGLEELKLRAEGAELKTVPALENLEEIELSGFTFTEKVVLNAAKNEYKFVNCTFNLGIEVTAAAEIEFKGGNLGDVTIIAAEEVEIENATAGVIDLTQMKSGEVELENVTYTELKKSESPDVEFEEE